MNQPNETPDPSQAPAAADVDAQVEAELAGKSMDELMQEADVANAPPPPAEGESAEGEAPAEEEPVRMQYKRGRITAIDGDNVFVDLVGVDASLQGMVPLTQFDRAPRIGSIMDFVVEREDPAEGLIILSREGAVSRTTWDHLHQGSVVEARVTGKNKGGLELEILGGIRAFMPASQVDVHHIEDLEPFVGQKLVALVGEVNRRGKKVLLSRRRHLEHERAKALKRIWTQLEVGQTVEGTVSSLAPYGAFVDVGGVDGLIHVSDLSYGHINKPEEVVKKGQTVTVKVLKLEPEKQRISLGLKQVAPDPWDTTAHTLRKGDKVTGTVLRTADFGAFVQLQPGVEGLLPISEMSWKRIHRADEVVKIGEEIHLAILNIDVEKRRLTLSLKQAVGDPWVGAEHRFPKDAEIEGTVRSTTDFGAFVEIESGIEGMAHISELSEQRIDKVEDVLKVGETKSFRVIETDEDNRRMRLSLRPAGSAEREPQRGGGGGGGRGPRGGGQKVDRKVMAQYAHKPGKTGEPLMLSYKPAAEKEDANKPLKGGIE